MIEFAKTALMDELYTSAFYRSLSKTYKETSLSKKLSDMADMEGEHAAFWIDFLGRRDFDAGYFAVNKYRVLLLTLLYRMLGVGLTIKILEIGERNAIAKYSMMLKSSEISDEEKEFINKILVDELKHEEEFEEYESRYKFFINKVATIFTQMSGGLVTVLSVSVGLSGVYGEPFIVALAGLIVGLTGAFNTLTGFYFFSRTQRQVKLGILKRINAASEHVPHIFVNKVIDHMKGKDLSEETARKIADEAYAKNFLDKIIAEEEYGIKEESLGDPLQTALYAGLFRIIGTVFPLAPYFFNLPFTMAIPMSILITLMMLTVTGSLVALSAEVDVKDKIVELIVSGIILTTLTYLVGKSTSILLDIFIK